MSEARKHGIVLITRTVLALRLTRQEKKVTFWSLKELLPVALVLRRSASCTASTVGI